MASKVPALVIAERDAVMYEMKKAGLPYRAIGKHFNVSEATAHRGVARMQERIRDRMNLDHAAEARMDIERMDDMLRQLLPLTKPSKIEIDGSEVAIPLSFDAVDRVLKIIAQRGKFFGYDKGESLSVTVNAGGPGGPGMGGEPTKAVETTPKEETIGLLKVFEEAGIMDSETIARVREMMDPHGDDIVDAEVVEDTADPLKDYDPVAIDPVRSSPPSSEPPEIVDEYDEEFPDD